MSRARSVLCNTYLAIALLALIGTWRQTLAFAEEAGVSVAEGFVAFWPALLVNRATTSIAVDIALLMLAAVVWMVLEARRLGMEWGAVNVAFTLYCTLR